MTDVIEEQLSDFGELYGRYKEQEPIAQQLLQGQHRYLKNLSFDPLTGEALPQRMSHWLNLDHSECEGVLLQDRFTHLIEHCVDAIGHILLSPRQTVTRVHEMTPVYLAQRLDSRSVQWLSRKPGNNMREKLAANPHILAATRKMSFDTLENRLLKTLMVRIEGLLLYRKEAGLQLTEKQEDLLVSIQRNLQSEDFTAIKPWQHMPPNNVLLQDKQYRKVWRAWQLLQRLEEDCQRQQSDFVASGFGVFSELLKQLAVITRCVLLDQAWQFKLDDLSVVSAFDSSEKLAPVKVSAIDLGMDNAKDKALIKQQAELVLTLSAEGHIRIQRRVKSEQLQYWQLNFQQSDGLISVAITSEPKSRGRDDARIAAMPADFPRLAKRLIEELLPSDCKSRHPARPVSKECDDFVTLMFDGASCKLKLGESAARFIKPQLLDASGLDCSPSLALPADAEVFSARELSQINGDTKSRQLGGFSDRLANQFQAEKGMHYLVNDQHSEFETNDLRREINRNFSNANPLPKSIAAIYTALEKNQFKHNDLIMVLSSDDIGIYATPVYYCKGKKLGDEYLERHPSIRLSHQGEKQLLHDALVSAGLPDDIAARYIDLYSYREIVSNKAQLILQKDKKWYRVPEGLKAASIDVSDVLLKEARKLQKKANKTFFISVSAAIKPQKEIKSTQWLSGNPILGSQQLLQKQYKKPHKVFWKDHLPQLMTRLPVKGIEQNFYFVDSETSVKPERGVAINIPIPNSFILPRNQEEIRFTIYQGKDSNRQEFSLLLLLQKALNEDCECNLTLTYTYGDEQPYKLRFTPTDSESKPFHYVDAQWGKRQIKTENCKPDFLERLPFENLRALKGNKGEKDIIGWLTRNFQQLDGFYRLFTEGENDIRFNFGYEDINWVDGRDFGFLVGYGDDDIFVHRNQFKDLDTENEDHFSGQVFEDDKGLSLGKITVCGQLLEYERKNLHQSWRFPMLTFGDQGRSFTDDDVPKDFAQLGKKAIEQAESLLTLKGIDNTLEIELKQFLSYCHKLIPQSSSDQLLQASTNIKQLRVERNRVKYALGDVSQSWQQELLEKLLQSVDDSGDTRAVALEILSVAMWRDEAVIHQLTKEQVIALARRLNEYLLNEISSLKKQSIFHEWNAFILRLELILALLRTRESSDSDIRSLFAIGSSLSEQLLSTVENITDKQGIALADKLEDPRVVSRVKLNLSKPDGYHRTPDLLYALKLYLSGEDGADQISIAELVNSA